MKLPPDFFRSSGEAVTSGRLALAANFCGSSPRGSLSVLLREARHTALSEYRYNSFKELQ